MLSSENKSAYMGGEFGLSIDDFLRPEIKANFNYPEKKNQLYLDTGRSAIYIALLSIIEEGGKREAWLPRYCCKSVLLPFIKLGFKLKFYSLGGDLKSPNSLPAKLDGETFFFIHYFGKRNQVILDYLEKLKNKQVFFVIEDCVQALLNSNLGTHDFIVYSYRKYLPQPDGALLSSDFPLCSDSLLPANEAFVSQRMIGKLIRDEGDEGLFLDLFTRAEEIIDNCSCPRDMSCLSHYLLDRTDSALIARKRRDNFLYLLQALKQHKLDFDLIHPFFDSLEHDEVPLGLPVVINSAYRDRLRDFLISQQIYCPVHWSLEAEESISWKDELELSRSLLTLPLDQRLDYSGLDYLAERLSLFLKRTRGRFCCSLT
jgi:hypothetical protein